MNMKNLFKYCALGIMIFVFSIIDSSIFYSQKSSLIIYFGYLLLYLDKISILSTMYLSRFSNVKNLISHFVKENLAFNLYYVCFIGIIGYFAALFNNVPLNILYIAHFLILTYINFLISGIIFILLLYVRGRVFAIATTCLYFGVSAIFGLSYNLLSPSFPIPFIPNLASADRYIDGFNLPISKYIIEYSLGYGALIFTIWILYNKSIRTDGNT